jgi:hypothetical protein
MISSHFASRTSAFFLFTALVFARDAALPQMIVPDKWADAPVVLCEDSLLCDLKVDKNENNLDITEISWYKVQRSNTGDLRELRFWDNEFIEKKPWLQVMTFDDNGKREKVGNDCIRRERTSEDPRAQFNIYVHKTGIFVTKVAISSYDRVRFIRTEQRRSKVKAVFFGRIIMRGPYPIVHKTVRIRVPEGMGNTVGVFRGGAANMDTITRHEGATSVITVSCTDLGSLPNKNILYPERWVPSVHLRFPPKAAALYSWKQIGDYYLDMIAGPMRPSDLLNSIRITMGRGRVCMGSCHGRRRRSCETVTAIARSFPFSSAPCCGARAAKVFRRLFRRAVSSCRQIPSFQASECSTT